MDKYRQGYPSAIINRFVDLVGLRAAVSLADKPFKSGCVSKTSAANALVVC